MSDSIRWPVIIAALVLVVCLLLFARGGDGEQRGRTMPVSPIPELVQAV